MRITLDPSPRRVRGRTPDTTRRELVARYQRSGLSQRAFCEQAGLPMSTLQWWLVKGRREVAAAPSVTFAEIPRPDRVAADDGGGASWAVEIRTHTGLTVRLREPLAPGLLRVLLSRARC